MKTVDSEFKKADHLLYVSLKYTKTTEVIRNVIRRWESTIGLAIDKLLSRAKRKKRLKQIPTAPIAKTDALLKIYKDNIVKQTVQLYLFFRRIDTLQQIRQSEFRKNLALIIIEGKHEVRIDLPKLYEWHEEIGNFLSYVREKV